MTDEAKFLKKKIGGPNLGSMGLNQAQNEVFRHFMEFESHDFLEIGFSDSLRQFLTSRRGKTLIKKVLAIQIWAKRAKIGPEIRGFFAVFSSLVY